MQTTDTSIPTLIAETKRYAGTDMLCYRAPDEKLAEEQRRLWDPIVSWAQEFYGIRLELTEGLMPVEQPAETLAALEAAVDEVASLRGAQNIVIPAQARISGGDTQKDPRLRGDDMHGENDEYIRNFAKLTKLLGSLIVALAVKERVIDADTAIEASFLEETFQAKKWGEDEEAAAKRAAKMAECRELMTFYL